MNYGIIRGVAEIWEGPWPIFRILVVMAGAASFQHLYIPASNYRFGMNDVVSWGEGVLYWHAATRAVKFHLLETGVAMK